MSKFFLMFAIALGLSGCANTAEKERLLQEYRIKFNNVIKKSNLYSDIVTIAIKDEIFAKVYRNYIEAQLAGKKIKLPRLVSSVQPTYPIAKRYEWKEAYLFFALIIGKHGNIEQANYIEHPEIAVGEDFVSAAREAIEKWTFEPGTIENENADFTYLVPVVFRLE